MTLLPATRTCINKISNQGTSLQGYVRTSYVDLVAVFGPPNGNPDGYKVNAEWVLYHEQLKCPVTIYDWKENVPPERVTEWHIGGMDGKAVEAMQTLFPQAYPG